MTATLVEKTYLLQTSNDGNTITVRKTFYPTEQFPGSQAANIVLFDNTAYFNDNTAGRLNKIRVETGALYGTIAWEASTPIEFISAIGPLTTDFSAFNGIKNPGGAGATGNLVFVTDLLNIGSSIADKISIIMEVTKN